MSADYQALAEGIILDAVSLLKSKDPALRAEAREFLFERDEDEVGLWFDLAGINVGRFRDTLSYLLKKKKRKKA